MKLTPYKKILTMAKEAIQEALAPVRAMEMKKKAELEIAKMDGNIIEQESKIAEMASKYPIDFDGVIKAMDQLGLMERRRKQFQKIKAEMFEES